MRSKLKLEGHQTKMCGILFEILYDGNSDHSITKDVKILESIFNRGPDTTGSTQISVGDNVKILFYGAVLWMQGPSVTPQPLETEQGILLYNGDIYDETWEKTQSDTQHIMNMLSSQKNSADLIKCIRMLKGPFSLIYYEKSSQTLYFTRDRIGRNTLLFHKSNWNLVISSVLGRRYPCLEIPATHIHSLNINTNEITLHSWRICNETEITTLECWVTKLEKQQSLPDEKFVVESENIIALENDDGVVKYIEGIAKDAKCRLTLMSEISKNITIKETVCRITELLNSSVRIRLQTQPQKCRQCIEKKTQCNHCSVGILFSGGLDCTILAFLANKYVPDNQAIELINVAFRKEAKGTFDVPDRLTGRQSLEELRKLCPKRNWIFKEIDVNKEELETWQKSVIADLVYPRQTILDESLGSALWFAARGQDKDYVSSTRVLLLGSGADELFGGYTRHRNAYKRQGWTGLQKELHLDWSRISFRNLSRDNRVICDHGRQPRMPYLDENLTDYVLQLKPWLKCFPSEELGQGVGDKLMLRLVAYNLGLSEVVTFPKRALQFGSRIANKKERGSDLSKTFIAFKIND